MPEQQQQQGNQSDIDFLWIMGSIIVGIYLIWFFAGRYIVSMCLHVRFYEILAINFVFGVWARLLQVIGWFQPQTQTILDGWRVFVQHNMSGAGVDFATLGNLSTVVGNYLRYPLVLIMFGWAVLLYFTGVSYKFRNVFDGKALRKVEQDDWPQIKPVVNLDLVNQKLDEAPWAVSLSPMRFCKKNNLLDVETKRGKYVATLRYGAAYRILSLQLGARWRGVNALPIYLKALFAIFAARINEDKKGADNLLDRIAISATGSKLNFTGVDELLRKYMNTKKVTEIISLHGYVTTVLASMLVGARGTGVLASSEFIWLKPLDRRMWYMLNSVGRPTAVAEICGAYAHWLAEKKLGLPLMVPMVEEAVRGLELAVSEMIYTPDEEEEKKK